MHIRILSTAVLTAASLAAPAMADLVVTTNLGTLASSAEQTLTGSTVGKANNAVTYSSLASATTTSVYGTGEYVYQFTLTKPAYLYLDKTFETDTTYDAYGSPNTPVRVSDHDYFLTNTLATTASDNTNTYFNGKPEATNIVRVTTSVGYGTTGSSANSGIFRTTANPTGLYAPGTYYLSVDGFSGSVNTVTNSPQNQNPAGNFSFEFNAKYLDEIAKPTAAQTELTTGGSITGTYASNQVLFYKFAYTAGQSFSVDTIGNNIGSTTGNGDTTLALYDSTGALVTFNDDTVGGTSTIAITAASGLASGEYYLGLVSYKAIANPAFDLSVWVNPNVAPENFFPNPSGTFVINGLSLVPEPGSLLVLAAVPAIALRRRRR